ncbi:MULTISPECIES: helix-turn-helix transcriptional regulator [Halomonadaceae]|uniref:helix-turn-helix transcriptional regulator n=1 Tax=Onishia taeanensis TaxID=284577 RepID=UPI0020C69C6F|nr:MULTISPECIES: AlpA family phage regulatory protein [Halomonas]MDI4636700.1 AlpA family phage regulatory protein [Halomonas sp. BMC7]
MKDLIEKLGISRSSIYEMLNSDSPRYDPTFPKPVKLGARSVGWIEGSIDIWLCERQSDQL